MKYEFTVEAVQINFVGAVPWTCLILDPITLARVKGKDAASESLYCTFRI